MGIVKSIAWVAIFIVGFFVLGTVAVLTGGAWKIVWFAWMGFWIAVAILTTVFGEPF